MTSLSFAIVSLLAIGSCKKKDSEAASTGMMQAEVRDAAPATKRVTPEDIGKRFDECWGSWNAAKWDDFKGCYAANAVVEMPGSDLPRVADGAALVKTMQAYRTAFPDEKGMPWLVLINGKTMAAVTLVTGKQSGALELPDVKIAPTNKTMGFSLAQMITVDDAGKTTNELEYFDLATLVGQLQSVKEHPVRPAIDKPPGPEQVVIAKSDDKEKANKALFEQLVESFNKHDLKRFGDLLPDDAVWSELAMPKDQTKKELMTALPQMWKGFSDLKLAVGNAWTAGDYVVASETFEGTNDGDVPMMHLKKTDKKVSLPLLAIHRIEGGKVKASWIFYQGAGFAKQLGLSDKTK